MQVILLNKVEGLGRLGDLVNVRPGYARNFLIPQGKAVPATKKNIEYFKARRTEIEAQLTRMLETAKARAEQINALGSIMITSKAGKEGKLFGSIGTRDIAYAITSAGIKVTKNEVRLPNGSIRTIGSHEVNLYLHNEVFVKVFINVTNTL